MTEHCVCVGVVMPFWTDGGAAKVEYLYEAVQSIVRQTYSHWRLYIVDDASDPTYVASLLGELSASDPRINIIYSARNSGPGHCRNIGINRAAEDGCEYISFLDADDLAVENRLETVVSHFRENSDIDVCYSGFVAIDEHGVEIDSHNLIEGMGLLCDQLKTDPLVGKGVWKTVFCERDGITIPSSLNVRTSLAKEVPFTSEYRFHEDTHAWVRYSAYGAAFSYIEGIEARYRVLNNGQSSESRIRAGGIDRFNEIRYEVGLDSLEKSLTLAEKNESMSSYERQDIRRQYYRYLGGIIEKEGSVEISKKLFTKAALIDMAVG